VDLLLDLHGDEELPHIFLAGNAGIPGYTERLAQLQDSFYAAMLQACPEFQTEQGYPIDPPGRADLSKCSKQVGSVVNGRSHRSARSRGSKQMQ
jgi:murein tripeptide amidase MpaA